ncbi:uncharacterized protein EKO05_0007943 [Ascochyta rabiei]|uniref:Uncharacterized protein n=1 Tax=Didymella rabiei TaxID=5454 RepID=A0A163CB39_DIDRA|nr:uncharacterized protein EKO05_0007943 [Ascochyta rabiei]KZM22334.1 hypothetical protein ST47_g6522 [Ascochyta rabiei]UPX17599.1 hypothetical protein EKO05_0007943 [Ascochyta rabiei]
MPIKFYNHIGFNKGYNFILWFIFGGAMIGFVLARAMYLDFNGQYCPSEARTNGSGAAPGECYYYRTFPRYKIGILLHLAGILPASAIAVIQFTPFFRQKWIVVHRIGGYVAIVLYIISLAGVLMIARHALGGSVDVQAWCGFVGFGVLACFGLSWYNIKRLQIEQHRAWMLRGWFYAGSIITSRLIMIIAALITSNRGGYYAVWTCAKILSTYPDRSVETLVQDYPSCASWADGSNSSQVAPVPARFAGGSSATVGAALNISFGAALWLAFNLHALGVEIYLALTPREAERLRKVSYARQLEAGMQNPGSAGLTTDRLGDSERWVVPRSRASQDSVDAALVQQTKAK